MAVLSSHPPERIITDQKSQSVTMATTTIGEEPTSLEVNGHVSPTILKPEATTETTTETTDQKDEAQSPKQKTEEVVTSEADRADDSAPEKAAEVDDAPVEASTAPVKDTEMVDAPSAPTEEPAPPAEKPVDGEKPAEEPSEKTKDATPVAAPESSPEEPVPAAKEDADMSGVDSTGGEPATTNGINATQNTSQPSAADASFQASTLSNGASQEDSSAPATADTSMTDAPSQTSIKVAREREDDAADEPAAKRAKTSSDDADETKTEDVVQAATSTVVNVQTDQPAGEPAPLALTTTAATLTDPALNDKPITTFQAREIRKILAGVKKTKNGGMFKQSVQVLWPTIWDQYIQRVEKPTDITTMEQKLREFKFATMGDFKQELKALYENSVTFNGPLHDVTGAAKIVVEQIFGKMSEVPAEPTIKAETKEPKHIPTRHAEPRSTTTQQQQARRESRGAATSPVEKVSDSPVFAVPPSGVPIIRRDSTKNDGDRPKRPIHPPKNKDIGYQAKNLKKKKVQPDFRFCDEVLNELKKNKHYQWNTYFLEPVDPVVLNVPTYHKVIKQPMDLGTMTEKLHSGQYESAKAFENDFNLMLKNCYKFNPPGHLVHAAGQELEKIFKEKWAEKDAWMAKHAPAAPAASSHAASGTNRADTKEEDSEEDNEDDEQDADEEPESRLLDSLQARLKEEQKKLDDAINAPKPEVAMVHLQQQVISMIQNQIIEEKMKGAGSKEKKPASKPKPSKSKKATAGGGGGAAKKSTNAAPAKKSTGGSKKAKPRKLSAEEKEIISEGIGRLEGNLLDKAIDIIKKDTNLPDTDDAELELDMEQLSDDALLRLFDMIVKAFPEYKAQLKDKHQEPEPAPRPAGVSKATKPKKNKPMGKAEQERKLEQLRELKAKYPRPGSGSQEPLPSVENGDSSHAAPPPAHYSDEDSSSEEE
ncbi:Bromodomain protein-3 [Pleurostoma richardsiae]|uniref:Bromodomain protein-3 n=1 Tax=Pleurostoma richardsiae TaxID=41990 RepID=A0AA38RJS1_9PEZI|nr:Bromodomain protein-3 [Pleurostoma richardsiae]